MGRSAPISFRFSLKEKERDMPDLIEDSVLPCADCGDNPPIEGHRFCGYCRTLCQHCNTQYDSQQTSHSHCPNCYVTCERCDRTMRTTQMTEVGGSPMCVSCSSRYTWCRDCNWVGNMNENDEMRWCSDAVNWYCVQCSSYCDSCDEYHRSECQDGSPRGVRGYGHTHPEMWLGGPLPRNERGQQVGFYVGFELEITAGSGDDANVIKQWSTDNLGVNIFDCKEDSSVDGFEIATQPMTPEYFEAVPWNSFFAMLKANFRTPYSDEPDSHGLHVHIGRVAFRSDVNIAAFSYLLCQGRHLERIGRRNATHYCSKVDKPVSAAAVAMNRRTLQSEKLRRAGVYAGRNAINLGNEGTIEIRAFKSTREAQNLRNAVRLVYVAAEYIRALTAEGQIARPRALHWGEFAKWVAINYPKAFSSISGLDEKPATKEVFDADAVIDALAPVNTIF